MDREKFDQSHREYDGTAWVSANAYPSSGSPIARDAMAASKRKSRS